MYQQRKVPEKERKMKKRLRILSGVFLFCVGVICFLYPNLREWETQREVDSMIKELTGSHNVPHDEQEDDNIVPEEEKTVAEERDESVLAQIYAQMQEYNQQLTASGQNIADAWSDQQTQIDLSSLNSDTVGYIEIPDMEVRLPLYIGASNDNLAKGAAVMAGTSMPIGGESTNCVIAGHRGWRGSAYFKYIENVKAGSVVYITNLWETLTYRVTGFDIVTASAIECTRIQKGKDMVTLVSCHPYAVSGSPYRYIVYCERAEEGVMESADEGEQADIQNGKTDMENELVLTKEVDFLAWEEILRTALPALTLLLAGIVTVSRSIRERRSEKK